MPADFKPSSKASCKNCEPSDFRIPLVYAHFLKCSELRSENIYSQPPTMAYSQFAFSSCLGESLESQGHRIGILLKPNICFRGHSRTTQTRSEKQDSTKPHGWPPPAAEMNPSDSVSGAGGQLWPHLSPLNYARQPPKGTWNFLTQKCRWSHCCYRAMAVMGTYFGIQGSPGKRR